MKHIPFPSIEQFRNVIRNVNHRVEFETKPTLDYIGTVKLHGTNAAIVILPDDTIQFQSRNSIITPQSDNAGFATFFNPFKTSLCKALPPVNGIKAIIVYGEWCGQSIQKGVAISGLPKMFVVFAIRIVNNDDSMLWATDEFVSSIKDHSISVYNIFEFKTFSISIDFNNPLLSVNALSELTISVESECPVAKSLGVLGVGEGIVWHCITPGWESSDYWFKVKGEKHSVTKVKTLASVDTEKLESLKEFVSSVVTESRCQQGISHLKESNAPMDRTSLGKFLSWVVADVIKEESDTIKANNLTQKDVTSAIAIAAKNWFFLNEDSL